MINNIHLEEENTLSLRQIKNIILTLIIAGLFFVTQAFAAGVKNIDGIKKDIKVISNLLENSTELDSSRSKIRVSGNYLAKQGMVFKVRFPGSNRLDFNISDFRSFPSPPEAPELFSSEEDLEALVADSMEVAELAMLAPDAPEIPFVDFTFSSRDNPERQKLREQQRQLRSQQRELDKKARNLEKEARKNKSNKSTKELKKLQAELKTMSKQLKQQSKEMRSQMLALTKQARDKRQKKMNIWTINLLDNFCSYAPYPRNLPRNEYLTLVLSKASYVGDKTLDKVIVLSNSQLNDCREGKMKGKDLLEKSIAYSF
jgi:myosin heavy subunit